MIGIIVAMDKEMALLLPLLENHVEETRQGCRFHRGTLGGRQVVAMKCGIGKVNSALGAKAMIDAYAPSAIVNTGVAGGAGGEAGIMDVVVGTRIAYHDVWCGPGTEWGQAAGCPLYFTSAPELSSLPALHGNPSIKHGLVCSGDIFVADPEITATIRRRFPEVVAVDMESASIAQTCYLNRIPFLCLRVVSDTPGDSDNNMQQYEDFWDRAPEKTFAILKAVIGQMNE